MGGDHKHQYLVWHCQQEAWGILALRTNYGREGCWGLEHGYGLEEIAQESYWGLKPRVLEVGDG